MIDANHLYRYVIQPVLADLKLGGVRAELLVLGTACVESHCGLWLVQLDNGPARGIFQMEPATEEDIWSNFLAYHQDLAKRVNRWRVQYGNGMADEMTFNLAYAAVMCRLQYYRRPEPLPDDLPGHARYWKDFYNTAKGAGQPQDYMNAWQQFAPAGLVA